MTTEETAPEPDGPALVMIAGAVDGLLEPTSVEVLPAEIVVAVGRPGHGNTALALALAGRLVLDAGFVSIGEDTEPERLQRAVVLVDVPGVTEPDDPVPFRAIVGEELALAGRPAGPGAVSAWLREHEMDTSARIRTEDVEPVDRLRTLVELGASRPDAEYVVVVCPDRHGLHLRDWWPIVRAAADSGLGVLVTVGDAVDLADDGSFPVARTTAIGRAHHEVRDETHDGAHDGARDEAPDDTRDETPEEAADEAVDKAHSEEATA